MADTDDFSGWALVEIMGHDVVAGHCSTASIAGTPMLRVDVPAVDEIPAFTQFVGGAAIYRLTPLTEEMGRLNAQMRRRVPLNEFGLPRDLRTLIQLGREAKKIATQADEDNVGDNDEETCF